MTRIQSALREALRGVRVRKVEYCVIHAKEMKPCERCFTMAKEQAKQQRRAETTRLHKKGATK